MTKVFDSYTTNNHYVGSEQLVWIVGYDDRKSQSGEMKQLMGHTKAYTKVVLDSDKATVQGQPSDVLIGKCIKIKVTEACKWHITGYIINAHLSLEEQANPKQVLSD